ncbi:MAG: Smr/MutS family protein [Thermoanaerobaculia bacterium]|nr:Smr/MutS family protein [Thermoanaerobaculia bacterium]
MADDGHRDDVGATEPVEMEITDTLDLHSFPPREVAALVKDWIDLAYDAGHRELRIIHGKGIGVQRQTVRKIAERDGRVVEFGDAPDGSGWGATRIRMR